jgi:hypothetical protein
MAGLRLLIVGALLVSTLLTPAQPVWAELNCAQRLSGHPVLADGPTESVLDHVFYEYAPKRKEGWCSGNVYFELKKILAEGGSIEDLKVLYFYNGRASDFRLWGTPEEKLNEFHVVLYHDGLVYDVHAKIITPMPLKAYVEQMFFRQGLAIPESSLWDIIHVRELTGPIYLKVFKQGGSGGLAVTSAATDRGSLREFVPPSIDPRKMN